jgi:hypothetical protein
MNKIRKKALFNALATSLYIMLVGSFMYYGSSIKIGKTSEFLAPIALLSLFVFSAALTGFLIFGKPALMYIDGKKKEALSLLAYTLGFFSITTFITIILLVILSR